MDWESDSGARVHLENWAISKNRANTICWEAPVIHEAWKFQTWRKLFKKHTMKEHPSKITVETWDRMVQQLLKCAIYKMDMFKKMFECEKELKSSTDCDDVKQLRT